MHSRSIRSKIKEGLAKLENQPATAEKINCKDAFRRCAEHESVREVCKQAGLDPENPAHLMDILRVFSSAWAGKPGRREIWTMGKSSSLVRRYLIVAARMPGQSVAAVLEIVKADVAHLRDYTTERLRRALYQGLQHTKNPLLRNLLENMETMGFDFSRVQHPSVPDWTTLPAHDDKIKWLLLPT
jgi:hypothetical protein